MVNSDISNSLAMSIEIGGTKIQVGIGSASGKYELDGQVLLLGVGQDSNTTIHLCENLAGFDTGALNTSLCSWMDSRLVLTTVRLIIVARTLPWRTAGLMKNKTSATEK